MEAVKTHITVESDVVRIPELNRFIGKRIEIILLDASEQEPVKTEKFKKLNELKGKIHFDANALNELRQNSII